MNDQSMEALAIANTKRLRQTAIKRDLKDRTLTLAEALESDSASDIKIAPLMEAVPYLTPERVATVLLIANIGYARRVCQLRERDRWALLHLVAERYPGIRVRP